MGAEELTDDDERVQRFRREQADLNHTGPRPPRPAPRYSPAAPAAVDDPDGLEQTVRLDRLVEQVAARIAAEPGQRRRLDWRWPAVVLGALALLCALAGLLAVLYFTHGAV